MKTKIIIVVVAIVVFGFSMWSYQSKVNRILLEDEVIIKDEPELVGDFRGLLPCADCAGIDTVVILIRDHPNSGDGTYQLLEIYPGKSEVPFTSSGRWTTLRGTDKDENAIVYQLNPDQTEPVKYFKHIDEKTIRLLDTKGNEINSSLPYDLIIEE